MCSDATDDRNCGRRKRTIGSQFRVGGKSGSRGGRSGGPCQAVQTRRPTVKYDMKREVAESFRFKARPDCQAGIALGWDLPRSRFAAVHQVKRHPVLIASPKPRTRSQHQLQFSFSMRVHSPGYPTCLPLLLQLSLSRSQLQLQLCFILLAHLSPWRPSPRIRPTSYMLPHLLAIYFASAAPALASILKTPVLILASMRAHTPESPTCVPLLLPLSFSSSSQLTFLMLAHQLCTCLCEINFSLPLIL